MNERLITNAHYNCNNQSELCTSFDKCTFIDCNFNDVRIHPQQAIGPTATWRDLPLFANAEFRNWVCTSIYARQSVFRDITIDGMATGYHEIFWGCIFHRVSLRGRIGVVTVNSCADESGASNAKNVLAAKIASQYYADADWSLDIREASFKSLKIGGIPSRLVLRNPATQGVIRRSRIQEVPWRTLLQPWNSFESLIIQMFDDSGDDEMILAAQTWGSKKECIESSDRMKKLRDCGVMDPE